MDFTVTTVTFIFEGVVVLLWAAVGIVAFRERYNKRHNPWVISVYQLPEGNWSWEWDYDDGKGVFSGLHYRMKYPWKGVEATEVEAREAAHKSVQSVLDTIEAEEKADRIKKETLKVQQYQGPLAQSGRASDCLSEG